MQRSAVYRFAQAAKPSTLAALVCALVMPFQISRPEISATHEPSPEALALVDSLSQAGMALARAQARLGIEAPIQVDLRFALALIYVHFIYCCFNAAWPQSTR
jgi:hypothetical protein